jgi:hypothetical protein
MTTLGHAKTHALNVQCSATNYGLPRSGDGGRQARPHVDGAVFSTDQKEILRRRNEAARQSRFGAQPEPRGQPKPAALAHLSTLLKPGPTEPATQFIHSIPKIRPPILRPVQISGGARASASSGGLQPDV